MGTTISELLRYLWFVMEKILLIICIATFFHELRMKNKRKKESLTRLQKLNNNEIGFATATLVHVERNFEEKVKRDYSNDDYKTTYECRNTLFFPDTEVHTHYKAYKKSIKEVTPTCKFSYTAEGKDYSCLLDIDPIQTTQVCYYKSHPWLAFPASFLNSSEIKKREKEDRGTLLAIAAFCLILFVHILLRG